MIDQSSYIAAFLVIGFIVFITMRGELQAYENVLFGTGGTAASPQSIGINQNVNGGAITTGINGSLPDLLGGLN